jgi:hypothetical protein
MNFEDYRTIFVVGILVCVLLAAAPALSVVISLPRTGEKFSELWILGPNHMAEDYPFNVQEGNQCSVYLGIGNHMASSVYYAVYVKFRNETEQLPNSTLSTPSSLPMLYEFRTFAQDGSTWERQVQFSFPEVLFADDSCSVKGLTINDYLVSVDSYASYNSERKGFYFQLFFELWLYDVSLKNLRFHDRFVGLWLNMTGR